MYARLQGALLSAFALMIVTTGLQAQAEIEPLRLYCDGVDVVKAKRQTEIVTTWDDREVCYQTKVQCEKGKFDSLNTWVEWSWDDPFPYVQWFAIAILDPPAVGVCGDFYGGAVTFTKQMISTKKWSTSCKFPNGSKFTAKIAEVDGAFCGVED